MIALVPLRSPRRPWAAAQAWPPSWICLLPQGQEAPGSRRCPADKPLPLDQSHLPVAPPAALLPQFLVPPQLAQDEVPWAQALAQLQVPMELAHSLVPVALAQALTAWLWVQVQQPLTLAQLGVPWGLLQRQAWPGRALQLLAVP